MTLVKDMNDPKASILAHFPLNNMSVKLRFELGLGVKAPLPLRLRGYYLQCDARSLKSFDGSLRPSF